MWQWRTGWVGLVVAVAVCLGGGALSGLATASSVSSWYPSLARPSWTPPSAVFGPVWSILYLTMGIALWLVWRARPEGGGPETAAFAVQLALNLAWSVLFFGLRRPDLAFAEVLALWLAIVATIVVFWRASPVAGALLLPYLAWVSFATCLNGAFWRLNP